MARSAPRPSLAWHRPLSAGRSKRSNTSSALHCWKKAATRGCPDPSRGAAAPGRLTCIEALQTKKLVAIKFKEERLTSGNIDVITLAEKFLISLRRELDVLRTLFVTSRPVMPI
jgi:hypothetical protein